jgi:archaellum component FlaD/FlaE
MVAKLVSRASPSTIPAGVSFPVSSSGNKAEQASRTSTKLQSEQVDDDEEEEDEDEEDEEEEDDDEEEEDDENQVGEDDDEEVHPVTSKHMKRQYPSAHSDSGSNPEQPPLKSRKGQFLGSQGKGYDQDYDRWSRQ